MIEVVRVGHRERLDIGQPTKTYLVLWQIADGQLLEATVNAMSKADAAWRVASCLGAGERTLIDVFRVTPAPFPSPGEPS